MLTVLLAADDAQRLADTLEALVPAAVDGLVRQVVVSAGTDPAIAAVAEDAGAEIVAGEGVLGRRLAAAAALARSPWLFVPHDLPPDWRPRVEAQLGKGRAGRFRASVVDRLLGRARGLLLSRAAYDSAGGFRDVEAAEADLVKRLGSLDRL